MMKCPSPVAGCMRWGKWGAAFTTADYTAIIQLCIENGITSFDHADIYGDYTTEYEFGLALKGMMHTRNGIQLVTKCGIQMPSGNRPQHTIKSYNTSKAYIMASAERSLQNFHTDYIDLFLIHRPDPLLNPEEIAGAVSALKQSGKILHFGVSNFLPAQINMLQTMVEVEYNQIEVSLLQLSPFHNGMLDNCMQHKIIPMAWSPLGGGTLSDESHPRYRAIAACGTELAEKYATGINQILIAFLLAHPSGIIPVLGTTRVERLIQARDAAAIKLSREDWFKLYTASTGEEVA